MERAERPAGSKEKREHEGDLGLILYQGLASLAAFIATMFGGLLVLRYRHFAHIFSAFTGGVLIAIAVVDVLPETVNMASSIDIPLVLPFLIAASGFVFLFLFERGHHTKEAKRSLASHHNYGLIAGIEMVVHSLIEGLAIGIAFELSTGAGLVVALAVILHDSSDGLSLTTIMLNSGHSRRASMAMLTLEALAPALGIGLAIVLSLPISFITIVLAFIAGGLLYIGALEMLPNAFRNTNQIAIPALIGATGFSMICLVVSVM